jgi:hypothetical protein
MEEIPLVVNASVSQATAWLTSGVDGSDRVV